MKVIDRRDSQKSDGEVWFGVPTWDPADRNGDRSVKFAYKTRAGSWARTSPEVPEGVVWEMILVLVHHLRLHEFLGKKDLADLDTVVKALETVRKEII